LQLQENQRVYKTTFDAMAKIYRNEGLHGLYKGLIPAIFREGTKNLFCIGLFDSIMDRIHPTSKYNYPAPIWKRLLGGATTGAMGAIACNPFELIKTRMQAEASHHIAVGHQVRFSCAVLIHYSIDTEEW
jgi:hypothetical protein